MRRGSRAHAVLETTLRRLKAATGSAALTPASLPAALRALDEALDGIELEGARGAAARRTLEADLQRYLRHEAEYGAGMEPTQLEWRFGREGDEHGPLALGELAITGRVDRVDVGPGGEAIVRDYKGASAPPGAGWAEGGALQVALYMLAARELLGLEPVGGLYQALWSRGLAAARAGARRRAGAVRVDGQGLRGGDGRGALGGPLEGARDRRRAPGGRGPGVPREVLAQGLRVPDDLPGGRMTATTSPPPPAPSRSPTSSARRSRTATAPRCSPPTPARARPR